MASTSCLRPVSYAHACPAAVNIGAGCELPVHPPDALAVYWSPPLDCPPLETARSFEALQRGLSRLVEDGHIFLDTLPAPTFELTGALSQLSGGGERI